MRAVTGVVLCMIASQAMTASAADWSAQVKADLAHEIRPGGADGRAFWNGNAILFMYPPSFEFRRLNRPGKKIVYSFQIHDGKGRMHFFTADRPTASLAPVWDKLPAGYTTVTCRAQDGSGCSEITVGTRAFWKSAPFTGNYPAGLRAYDEAARLAFEYVLKSPSVTYFLKHGELDPKFQYNAYPTKMLSSIINAACRLAECDPKLRDEALALARKAADWLIAHSEKDDAPLPHFPPTYRGKEVTAGQYAGQVMLIYPASAALAYMNLYGATKDAKYLREAEAIAAVYLRLQEADGTWPIKMRLKDGARIGNNTLVPIGAAIPMMEKLCQLTGKGEYRKSAELAFCDLERKRIATWNWEGQFEDVEPSEPYLNLTLHDAGSTALYLAENFPKDAKKMALVRELARFTEDQFVCWEKPFDDIGYSGGTSMCDIRTWRVPGVLEQYYWYNPIDASAAKMIRVYLALWRVEKNPLDLAKAKALGDSITREQEESGLIHTHWSFEENANTIWMNCHIGSALALDELARAVRGE